MRKILSFIGVLLLLATAACGGCRNGNGGEGEATVTIEAVDPAAAYPGVEVAVTFSIEPGEGTNADDMQWEVRFGDGTATTGDGVEGEALHAYELAGQYDVVVSAIFDGEEVGSELQPIRIYSPVDLAVSDVRGAPANARAGEELQVSFSVTNNTAAQVFTPYEVAAYLSDSPSVMPDDLEDLIPLGTTTVEPDAEEEPVIDSGGSRESAFSITIPDTVPGGDYYVVAQLDPRGRIADTDVENNIDVSTAIVRVENLSESFPDLCVRDLYVTPDRAFPQLNTFTRGAVLCNEGGEDAFDVVLDTYLSIGDSDLDTEEDLLVHESEAVDVFANDTEPIGPEAIVLPVGEEIVADGEDVEVWVIVVARQADPNAVDSDEANNVVTSEFPIVVSDEPVMGPDIVVRSFTVSPDSTFLNGTLSITADIGNEGTADVGSFFCGIYLGAGPSVNTQNDPRLTNINIPSLPAGDETLIDMPITIPGLYDPGVYYLYIVCDPLNALQEPFRSNNAFIYPERITITDDADVDLFVEEVTVPGAVPEGETFEVVVRACVSGTNPSGATRANLFFNPGTQVDYSGEPALEFDIPSVLPGGENCEEVTLELVASCLEFQDRYAVGVEVDTDDRLPELDETNNRTSASNAVTVSGEFCQCDEDAFEPNDRPIDASVITEGVTEAAICTAGNCDYWGVDLAANDSLIARTRFNAEKGSLNTTLYDSTGLQVLASDSSDDLQEVATFLVPLAGQYVVRVCGATANDRNLYDLEVDVLPQVTGVDLVPRSVTIPFGDSFSIGADVDVGFRVYNLGTAPAATFDAEIYISPDPLLDDDGNNTLLGSVQIDAVSAGGIRDVNTTVTLPTTLVDGDYWLFVVLDPQGVTSDLDVTNNRVGSRGFGVHTECFDPLEPNDSIGSARDVQDGSFSNLQLCANQDDYYRLCLPTGKRFDVTVNFSDAEGDIDLELLNDQQQTLDSSANAGTDVEQVSHAFVNGDQCFYVHVRLVTLQPEHETTYSMEVNVEDVDPSLLCDSAFEPNDTFQTASSLVAAIGQEFALDRCPASDTDFYFLDLNAGQTVSLTATKNPASQPGTLRLQVYQPNQTPGPNKETGPGVPSATISNYVAPTTGTYFVQITVSSATRNVTYELEATGLAGVDTAPSNFTIGPGDYSPNDEVRFAFTLTNLGTSTATGISYEVFYSDSEAGPGTSLGTFSTADLAGSSSVDVTGRVDVPPGATTGTRYLRVEVTTPSDANPSNDATSTPITIVP